MQVRTANSSTASKLASSNSSVLPSLTANDARVAIDHRREACEVERVREGFPGGPIPESGRLGGRFHGKRD